LSRISKTLLIGRAVEALVEADTGDLGVALGELLDHRHGDLIVGLVLHHAVAEEEAELILAERDFEPELDGHAGLALADPLGVGLEEGEDLLAVGDGLALEHPPAHLIDLALGVGEDVIEGCEQRLGQPEPLLELDLGELGTRQEAFAEAQVLGVGGANRLSARRALGRIFGAGALALLGAPIGLLHTADVVGALAPVAQALALGERRAGLDDLAHRVREQVDVGGILDIGLHHEGVGAHRKGVVWVFFDQGMAGLDHHLVDALQDRGGEPAQVVLERLHGPLGLVAPVAVAEHLAHGAVLVGQLGEAIVVGVQPQAQGAEHQDLPLRHAGAPALGAYDARAVGAHRQDLGEDGEDLLAQYRRGVDVLQPAQQARDVIARARINGDRADVLFTALQLRLDDLAHGNEAMGKFWRLHSASSRGRQFRSPPATENQSLRRRAASGGPAAAGDQAQASTMGSDFNTLFEKPKRNSRSGTM
jgi:hypothetical protein